MTETESPLEAVEARRAKRKKDLADERDLQKAVDLEAVDVLEVEHGDSCVATVEVPFVPGMVTLVAVRLPTPHEVKRYRSRVTPKREGDRPDYVKAAEELGTVCIVYPDKEQYDAVLAKRPAVLGQLGAAALNLATGKEEEEGKG